MFQCWILFIGQIYICKLMMFSFVLHVEAENTRLVGAEKIWFIVTFKILYTD
jgi:hypothetical protein